VVYQYYFSTERGALGYAKNRHDFNKLIWKNGRRKWDFDDAKRSIAPPTARSFDNPDHVSIVIHNYRWRLSLAKGRARYDALEEKAFSSSRHHCARDHIASDFDGAAADGKAYANKFSGKYSHRILNGIRPQRASRSSGCLFQGCRRVDGHAT